MKLYRQLGILTALLGAGCESAGAMGAMGEMGAQGPQGMQGEMGIQGIPGIPGPETLSIATNTCMFNTPAASCTVVCPGVGAIALAGADFAITQHASAVTTLALTAQATGNPAGWRFDFSSPGIEGIASATFSTVCFTPPE